MGRYSLVSACLFGIKCRYDGTSALNKHLKKHLYHQPVLLVCPEKLAGLPTPRPPVQIMGRIPNRIYDGKDIWKKNAVLISTEDRDVTDDFLKGCNRIKELLKKVRVKCGFLKARSPACGYGQGCPAHIVKRSRKKLIAQDKQPDDRCGVYNRHPQTGKTYLVKGDGVLGTLLKNIRPSFPIKAV